MNCQNPKCKGKSSEDQETIIICDNNCGTQYCTECDDQCYLDRNRKIIRGHNPLCGTDTLQELNSSIGLCDNIKFEDLKPDFESNKDFYC